MAHCERSAKDMAQCKSLAKDMAQCESSAKDMAQFVKGSCGKPKFDPRTHVIYGKNRFLLFL